MNPSIPARVDRPPTYALGRGFATVGLALSVALVPGRSQAAEDGAPARPNVVVIFTDDQGWGDLGCYGSPDIGTPHLDRMADEGIRFTSFYAAPFCGPSRAQIMTGCYHPRVSHSHNEGPGAKTGLHPGEVTVAELLNGAGYATLHVGKWHLGDAPEFLPTRQGFDHFFGLPFSNDMWPYHPKMPPRENEDELMRQMRARAAYTGYAGQGSYYRPGGGFPRPLPLMRDEAVVEENPDQTRLTTRYTEEALRFIEAEGKRGRPFFLYLAHAMPHVPLFVSEKFAGSSARGLYGDVISEIDWSCGQIVGKLKALGIDQKTLVVFTSDNGPWLGYGIDGGSAGPFREGKGTTWEGGVRVPAIFRWPGTIPPGRRTNEPAGNIDILPTVAALAGVDLPVGRVIDGRDLGPLLTGKTDRGPHDFFHYFGGSRPGGGINFRAVRDRRWKLILARGPEPTPAELYDLGADPSEKFDRLDQHTEIADRLLAEARRFRKEITANRRPLGRVAARSGASPPSRTTSSSRILVAFRSGRSSGFRSGRPSGKTYVHLFGRPGRVAAVRPRARIPPAGRLQTRGPRRRTSSVDRLGERTFIYSVDRGAWPRPGRGPGSRLRGAFRHAEPGAGRVRSTVWENVRSFIRSTGGAWPRPGREPRIPPAGRLQTRGPRRRTSSVDRLGERTFIYSVDRGVWRGPAASPDPACGAPSGPRTPAPDQFGRPSGRTYVHLFGRPGRVAAARPRTPDPACGAPSSPRRPAPG